MNNVRITISGGLASLFPTSKDSKELQIKWEEYHSGDEDTYSTREFSFGGIYENVEGVKIFKGKNYQMKLHHRIKKEQK